MDFYHHARALTLLAPHADLLRNGSAIPVKGDNQELTFSAFGSTKEVLVLVGNYASTGKQTTGLSFPDATPLELHDLKTGERLAPEALKNLGVNPGQQRLFKVKLGALSSAS